METYMHISRDFYSVSAVVNHASIPKCLPPRWRTFPFFDGKWVMPHGFSRDHYSQPHIFGWMKQWKCMAIFEGFPLFWCIAWGSNFYWSMFSWPVGGVGAKKKSRFSTFRKWKGASSWSFCWDKRRSFKIGSWPTLSSIIMEVSKYLHLKGN